MNFPQSVCFRVTRACNARCGFCLAPWDGEHPAEAVLSQRIDWLLERGVRSFDFCGGEPTIHSALPRLIEQASRVKTRLTTNGISLPQPLLETLQRCRTHVKVSLHGSREWHNQMVGLEAFDKATTNLERLLKAGVRTSIQTTLVAGGSGALAAMVELCKSLGVRRLTLMPFIPRGDGAAREAEFALSASERRELRAHATKLRGRKLDIRWNDFSQDRAAVMEADGRLLLEGARESGDVLLGRFSPAAPAASNQP